jgi:mono/diheme cytochrome c family protein
MRISVAAALLVASACAFAQPAKKTDPQVVRGRYVVMIGGCNDCHTAGWAQNGGKTPEKDWLTGDALGWRGPWGTTYPVNLRLYMQGMTEDQWVKKARTFTTRPPMPWFNVRAMSTRDLRAMYRYLRHLGPAGKPAPEFVPPGKTPAGPYVQFPEPPKGSPSRASP